jgi:hypothetical protein
MAVNLSPVGGVAAQFFTNNGVPLTGGKIYTYAAGTTTPQATYTSSNGSTAWTNPIVLNAGGRVPSGGEIWLTDGIQYKFVLKDANDITIATYDNILGINSNFVNFTNEQEIQTATAGQTVFTLTTMQYQVGANSLSVFVDGVNQYGPGALYAYTETDSTTVTFTTGLHVGAEVKFTTSAINASSYGDASQISYDPPFTGSVVTNVEDKLAQTVSVKDFGAVGDGVADDVAAFSAAGSIASAVQVLVPAGTYYLSGLPTTTGAVTWVIDRNASFTGPDILTYVANRILSTGGYRSIESDSAFYNGIFGYLEQSAAITGYGTVGIHGSARSLGNAGLANEADIGVAAFGLNDVENGLCGVWGLYSTVMRELGTGAPILGPTHGMEIDVANMDAAVPIYPSAPFQQGLTSGIWLCTGGESSEPSAGGSPGVASVGLAIIQNDSQVVKTAKFKTGILFHNVAIDGADGTGSGIGQAIAFAPGHAMQWLNNSNQICAEIVSTAVNFTNTNLRMDFSDFGVLFQDRATGVNAFQIVKTNSAANYLQAGSATATNAPTIGAAGSDTNIDIKLLPKGTGVVSFGSYTAGSTSVAGYITIKDAAGNTRKLAVLS